MPTSGSIRPVYAPVRTTTTTTPLLDFLETQRKARKYRRDADGLVLTDENMFDDAFQIPTSELSAAFQQKDMAEFYNIEQRKARVALKQYNKTA